MGRSAATRVMASADVRRGRLLAGGRERLGVVGDVVLVHPVGAVARHPEAAQVRLDLVDEGARFVDGGRLRRRARRAAARRAGAGGGTVGAAAAGGLASAGDGRTRRSDGEERSDAGLASRRALLPALGAPGAVAI